MSRRTILASLLIAIAIAAPLAAWYVAGTRDVERESAHLLAETKAATDARANAIAKRISVRLELLRRMEARRAADDWKKLTNDEPLIVRDFELREHDPRAAEMLASVAPQMNALHAGRASARQKQKPKPAPPPTQRPPVPMYPSQQVYLNTSANTAWFVTTVEEKPQPLAPVVGELVWRTIGSSLMALRPAIRDDGSFIQGLEAGSLIDEPNARAVATNSGATIGGTSWSVIVDDRTAIDATQKTIAQNRRAFQRTFIPASAAGALALIAIIIMLWQTDRTATERARFAAAAAHELRTPLASLRLYGDMLAENLGNRARAADYARTISNEAERLGRVVANVIDYSRLAKGSLTIHAERDDLGNAIETCVDALRPAIASAGCDVRVAIEPSLPRVAVDREALFHIAQNLIDNAERYSRSSRDRTIDVSVARNNGSVILSVADRGPGMHGTKPRHARSGLGLGLSLVDALTRAHGGSVAWSSRDGGGTVVSVAFPA